MRWQRWTTYALLICCWKWCWLRLLSAGNKLNATLHGWLVDVWRCSSVSENWYNRRHNFYLILFARCISARWIGYIRCFFRCCLIVGHNGGDSGDDGSGCGRCSNGHWHSNTNTTWWFTFDGGLIHIFLQRNSAFEFYRSKEEKPHTKCLHQYLMELLDCWASVGIALNHMEYLD